MVTLKSPNNLSLAYSKRYINPAVVVEMSFSDMSPFKNNVCCHSYYDENPKIVRVKTCTCAVEKESCPSHAITDRSSGDGYLMHRTELKSCDSRTSLDNSGSRNSLQSSTSHCTVIVKSICNPATQDELKLSLASLTSHKTISETQCRDTENAFRKWIAEKNRQKKIQEQEQMYLKEIILKEKEKKINMERQNFIEWITNKKSEERKKRELKQKMLEAEEREREIKLKRQILNEKSYQLWVKKKEEQYLVKKMNEHLRKLKDSEERQKRLQLNTVAYEEWLKNSKNKPTPVPSNRGLESLRTSVSISFINPSPWISNIEQIKPSTK